MNSRNTRNLASLLMAVSLASPLTFAAPRISQATSPSFEQGGTLTIQGSGFVRESADPHAVMLDMVDKAYITGELNTHHQSFDELDQVLRIDEDPDTLWWKPSLGATEALQAPSVSWDVAGRSHHAGAVYHLKGYNSFLGWPAAYGGHETPVDNSKLYVAWYLKMPFDPRYYWTVSPENYKGEFLPGENIEVNGIEGRFIGIGTEGHAEGMLHFELLGQTNTNNLKGEVIVGQMSGASTVFPSEFARGTGVGFEPPGSNKYLRVWEDPHGKEGVRISWTQMTVHDDWTAAPVTPGEWHLMEFMLDTESGELKVYTDRALLTTVDVSDDNSYSGKWSPTIALLGFNGKIQEFQDIKIDDIYMDKSFARVAIGDKPNFSELRTYELQYPVNWNSNTIDVKLNFGALNPDHKTYLYVIDEHGQVNENGYPLCETCGVPPSKVKLNIN